MKFEDLHRGRHIEAGPACVLAAEIIEFARKFDNQWFHTDPMRAESGVWNGLIASGFHTCSIAMQLVATTILEGSESYASPGLAYVKWPHPVRPNDLLTLHVDVLESKVSTSKPWLGVIRWTWRLVNQNDVTVLELEATSLFKLAA
ncbi:MaoC family dehydratase [Massilia sp. TWR1-2-2]|uniref:MaoC family dehydratase n=1 Tax=Massilia sp. TWR1-2-2 TaxID=2804584 RepID=UPI003CED8132